MKFVTILLLIAQLSHGKTWIEILNESDFKRASLLTTSEIRQQDSSAYDLRAHHRKILEEMIKGDPAVMTTKSLARQRPMTDLTIGLFSLFQLLEFHASEGEWQEVNSILRLAARVKSIVSLSEPDAFDDLFISATSSYILEILPKLKNVANPEKREKILKNLKSKWERISPTRSSLFRTRTGEIRFTKAIANDLRTSIRESNLNEMDQSPTLWTASFSHQISATELLAFPHDPVATKQKLRDRVDRTFSWLGSGETLAKHPAYQKKESVKSLDYYRKHSNGMCELYLAGQAQDDLARVFENAIISRLLGSLLWEWLLAESQGTTVNSKTILLSHVSPEFAEQSAKRGVRIGFKNRRIIVPPDPDVDSGDVVLEVPNLFPN